MKYTFYKICCLDENVTEVYVGSTKNFTRRKYEHKYNSTNHHYKIYQFIRNNGGWDNFNMIPIREEECETKIRAIIIEEEIRCDLKAKLNSIRAYITEEQLIERKHNYHELNKEKINEQRKEFRELNKERINEDNKKYYEENKDDIRERRHEKYETNKIDINDKRRENYHLIKDKKNEKNRIKIICECGGRYTSSHKSRHCETLKHQNFTKQII